MRYALHGNSNMLKHLFTGLLCLVLPFYLYAEPEDTTIAGIPIQFRYDIMIFPVDWTLPPINAYGEPVDGRERRRTLLCVSLALEKYPQELLQAELNKIYCLKTMQFFDVGYAGTYTYDAVYLTNDGVTEGYTDVFIERTFHHEFSSILFYNHPTLLDTAAWNSISDLGNNDPEGGVGAIREGAASSDIDTTLCALGFLTEYSLSDFENDINMLAEQLFLPEPNFWDLVDTYPKLKTKVNMLTAFYTKLDPMFTEKYFRGLD